METVSLNTFRGLGKTTHRRSWNTHILWCKYLLLVSLALPRKTGICRQIWKTQQTRRSYLTIHSPGLEDTPLGIEFQHWTSQPWLTPLTAHWTSDPMSEANRRLVLSSGGLCLLDIKWKGEVFAVIFAFNLTIITPQWAPFHNLLLVICSHINGAPLSCDLKGRSS